MYKIDEFSYKCGVIDCFAEMVKAGVKKLALTHPEDSAEVRDSYLEFIKDITKEYGISYYVEDSSLLSDLFPVRMNKGKYLVIMYSEENDISEYLKLKEDKKQALLDNRYDECRKDIAYRFGYLLGYKDQDIQRYIDQNDDKE